LQSGNLDAAKSAYDTLASSPAAQGTGPFAQALQQIGKALANDPGSDTETVDIDIQVTAAFDSANKVDITT
jgi:hypothetical protein